MKNKLPSKFFTLALSFFFALSITSSVFAVGVKPLRTELTIEPGLAATARIKVINSEAKEMTFKPELQPHVSNDDGGYPVPVELDLDDPFNIVNWISFSEETLILAAGETREVLFTVRVPEDAEPGGRFASLLYSPVVDKEDGDVKVQVRVASLILVTVAGDQRVAAELNSFGLKDGKVFGDKTVEIATGLNNSGNVHVRPIGSIELTDENGNILTEIARYIDHETGEEIVSSQIPVNLSYGNVLPGSSRTFVTEWNENIQPGKFIARLDLRYDDDQLALVQVAEIDIHEDLKIDSFEISREPELTEFNVIMTNQGTVYERPVGRVEIRNEYDSVVASPEILSDIEYIAPGETVKITVPWLKKQVPKGKYTGRLLTTYGFSNTALASDEIHFSSDVVDLTLYLVTGGGFLVLLAVIFAIVRKKKKK